MPDDGAALPPALIVAGPTASGKSALAIELARSLGGAIINADSMQTYRELRVLTARPSAAEEADVPHLLYGVRPAAEPGSVAWWRGAALEAMAEARGRGLMPILCGGTGMYFAALREGLAAVPAIGPAVREEARRLAEEIGPAALHARLAEADPASAARIRPNDPQRISRAWEVWRETGRGLASWQADQVADPAPWRMTAILLDPPREELRVAIGRRFALMLEAGAVAEVAELLKQGLPSSLPAMRAHGVPEISAYLRGEIDLAEAGRRTELVTAKYTKRQATWFRHHVLADPPAMHTINAQFSDLAQFSERKFAELIQFIRAQVDAPVLSA